MYSSHFWLLRSGDGGIDPRLGDRGLWLWPWLWPWLRPWLRQGALPESDEARGETLLLAGGEVAGPGRSLVSFRSLFLGLGLLAGASSAGDICDTSRLVGWHSTLASLLMMARPGGGRRGLAELKRNSWLQSYVQFNTSAGRSGWQEWCGGSGEGHERARRARAEKHMQIDG